MPTPKFIAAIDQGTTGTRCMLFDHAGRSVAWAYEEHKQIYPEPGWVEHDAEEIWYKTKKVIRAALDIVRVGGEDISAIGITNQRETTVVWDPETGKPYANAIVWQDTRTRDICEQLIQDGCLDTVRRKTGLEIATYFSGPKCKWLLDHVPGLREKAKAGRALFGNLDTWLAYKLTGQHITDYTNASRTLLMNLESGEWDEELLTMLGIPRSMLPAILPSVIGQGGGYTRKDGPFGAAVPLAGILGDQQAALFGQTCFQVGEAKNTYGTGSFMLLNTGREIVPSKHGLLTTMGYALARDARYFALEGSIAITGAAVQWLRDNLGLIRQASETEEISLSVPDTGGVYFVPAFSGLFAPHWDMHARGVIVGLTRYTNRAHIVRATLESICYQTREVLDAMEQDWAARQAGASGERVLKSLRVDGGASKNNFLMQLQADVLGVPVVRPTVSETTALGAAYAAGLGVGYWPNLVDLRENWQVDRVFEPKWNEATREAGFAGWRKAVSRAKGWA